MNCKDIKAAIDSASRRNPINGEAHSHLSGCPDCRGYSDQSNALLALLTAQPRVQAPADFNFRLSARIARAQAEPASPFAFLENLFGQTFSIKQAAASLAALAVMATGTTLYFQSSQQVSNSPLIAGNIAPVVKTVAKPELPVLPSNPAPAVNLASRSQGRVAAIRPAVLTQASSPSVLAQVSTDNKVRVYNSEKGHVSEFSKGGVYYGAESSVQTARPASFGSF
ncbi:MAG: hypothetical protein AAB401_16320 [Acidobacteriota bacterium]